MATVTIYPTDDGFLNNISGWYPSEGFNLSRNTSSSSADVAQAFMKFTTVGAGIGAGDTINSVTLYWNIYIWNDINLVASWNFFTDINNTWDSAGSWGESGTPPNIPSGVGYGTVSDGFITLGSTGLNNKALTTTIPKSNIFGVCIDPALGDVGPAEMRFYDKDTVNPPYIVIDYTPAGTGHLLGTFGMGG